MGRAIDAPSLHKNIGSIDPLCLKKLPPKRRNHSLTNSGLSPLPAEPRHDDLKDHKVVASKEEWDSFYRLILVLRSDGHIETIKRKRWTARQFVACCSLLVFVLVGAISGFGTPLLVVTIALGGVSMGLAYWQLCLANGPYERSQRSLSPFSSVSELLHVRRNVRQFRKQKYPSKLQRRRIRNPIVDYIMIALFYGIMGIPLWLLCSPLALVFQAMPEDCSVNTVVMSNSRMELD
jgi:hypothetical protein